MQISTDSFFYGLSALICILFLVQRSSTEAGSGLAFKDAFLSFSSMEH